MAVFRTDEVQAAGQEAVALEQASPATGNLLTFFTFVVGAFGVSYIISHFGTFRGSTW